MATALEAVRGVSLLGKFALVTGANGGMGLETTRALLAAGAEVTLACRSLPAANLAKEKLLAEKVSFSSISIRHTGWLLADQSRVHHQLDESADEEE